MFCELIKIVVFCLQSGFGSRHDRHDRFPSGRTMLALPPPQFSQVRLFVDNCVSCVLC